jgi:uncharacterized membrane protein
MKKFTLIDLVRQAIIASIYIVLVFAFSFMSFKDIQFRIAEILLILVFFDKKSVIGLTLGVIIANLGSPMLPYDMTFGVLATIITLALMLLFRKWPYIALLFPAIVNGLIVGLELYLAFELPYLISALSVFIGEFVVVYIFGLPIYYILKKINFEEIYFKEIQN